MMTPYIRGTSAPAHTQKLVDMSRYLDAGWVNDLKLAMSYHCELGQTVEAVLLTTVNVEGEVGKASQKFKAQFPVGMRPSAPH